jgi:hypothetical protein
MIRAKLFAIVVVELAALLAPLPCASADKRSELTARLTANQKRRFQDAKFVFIDLEFSDHTEDATCIEAKTDEVDHFLFESSTRAVVPGRTIMEFTGDKRNVLVIKVRVSCRNIVRNVVFNPFDRPPSRIDRPEDRVTGHSWQGRIEFSLPGVPSWKGHFGGFDESIGAREVKGLRGGPSGTSAFDLFQYMYREIAP